MGNELDIVVVNYGTKGMTEQCINSLRACTRVDYTVILVDNGSQDDSVNYLAGRFPGLRIVASKVNHGYAKACNAGARAGRSEHIIFLNSDILALPNWDRPLLDCLESDEKIAVVGPKLVNRYGRIMGAGVVGTNAHPIIRGWVEPDRGQYETQVDCVSVCGAAYMIKRRLIPILGFFDERYFFYFEETDYSYNARDKGYRVVYCPSSKMIHHHAETAKNYNVMGALRSGRQLFDEKWRHMMDDTTVHQ